MKTDNNHETNTQKKIIIFTITSPHLALTGFGIMLCKKLHDYIRENNLNVVVEMGRASQIDSVGKEADIILLAPDLATKEAKVKQMFPDKIVQVIENRDYGLRDAENILKSVSVI